MNTLIVVASLCVAAFASPILNKDLDGDWVLYKQTHKKTYSQDEEQMRWGPRSRSLNLHHTPSFHFR